jgi:hypothetical protein
MRRRIVSVVVVRSDRRFPHAAHVGTVGGARQRANAANVTDSDNNNNNNNNNTSNSSSTSSFALSNAVRRVPLLGDICHAIEQGVLSNSERVADSSAALRFDVVGAWHLALRYHLTRLLVDEHGFSYDAKRDLIVLPASAASNDALYVTSLVLDSSARAAASRFGASLEFVQCSRSTFVVIALYQLPMSSSSSSSSTTTTTSTAATVDEVPQHLPLDDYLEGEFLRLAGLLSETALCPPILNFCDTAIDESTAASSRLNQSQSRLQRHTSQHSSPQPQLGPLRIPNRFVPQTGSVRSMRSEKPNESLELVDLCRYT